MYVKHLAKRFGTTYLEAQQKELIGESYHFSMNGGILISSEEL